MTVTGLINGLVVLIEGESSSSTKITPVPLTDVEVNSRVVNFTAQVDIIQTYINKEENPIEAIYFFPIEEDAAVTEFTAEVDGRVVRAVVKEKEIARKDYQAAVKDRKTAVLLEETTPDVFQINVGHMAPGSVCRIAITYISELPVEGEKTRLTIPTTVAPRYTPSSDTSSSPETKPKIQHSDESPAGLKLNLEIFMKTRIESVESPSHGISNNMDNEINEQGYYVSEINFDGNVKVMDRDIIILIKAVEPFKPKVWLEKGPDNTTVAMLSLVPQFRIQEQNTEMIFLVDCSGSMNGQSMKLVKEALQLFLHSLPVNCYFNIYRFGSRYMSLFESSQIYDDNNLVHAKKYAENMSADMGGTEILGPLEDIYHQSNIEGFSRQVFMLTDGDVSNSTDCIEAVRNNAKSCRLFSFGVGPSASRHLVKGMSRAGHGTAAFSTYGENLGPKVLKQLRQAMQPCITDVKVKWGYDATHKPTTKPVMENTNTLFGKKEGESKFKKELYTSGKQAPSEIPAVYDGHRMLVYNMYQANEIIPQSFEIRAVTPDGNLYLTVNVDRESILEGKMIHQMYAKKIIQDLEENFRNEENQEEVKQMKIDMGVRYSIASKFTSFIGIDETKHEKVGVMLTRQVKNQIPMGFGGMMPFGGSSSSGDGEEDESFRRNTTRGGGLVPMGASPRIPPKPEEPPANGISKVLEIIGLQLADGMFRKDHVILEKYTNNRINAITQNAKKLKVHEDVWITAIVIAILERYFISQKDNWEMSVEKAKQWITNQGTDPKTIINKAHVFMQYVSFD